MTERERLIRRREELAEAVRALAARLEAGEPVEAEAARALVELQAVRRALRADGLVDDQ